MDIKNINTFIAVAELRSFTKAAAKLGCTQSTVSFQIKQLETEIGEPLFDRINHTIVLTEKGARLLKSAQQISILLENIMKPDSPEQEIHGQVRLAMADSLCGLLIGGIFPELHSKYPQITLKIIAAGTEDMFRLLNQNQVDLVYTLDSHIYDTSYKILREEQISTHFVCSPSHPLCGKKLTLQDLQSQDMLLTEKGMSYRKVLDEMMSSRSLAFRPILESGNVSLICDLVMQNMGISFLPDYTTKPYIENGTMKYLDVADCNVEVWTQLLCHRDKWISPAIQVVIDHLGTGNYWPTFL